MKTLGHVLMRIFHWIKLKIQFFLGNFVPGERIRSLGSLWFNCQWHFFLIYHTFQSYISVYNLYLAGNSLTILAKKNRPPVPFTKPEIMQFLKAYQRNPYLWRNILDEMMLHLTSFGTEVEEHYKISTFKQLKTRLNTKLGKACHHLVARK